MVSSGSPPASAYPEHRWYSGRAWAILPSPSLLGPFLVPTGGHPPCSPLNEPICLSSQGRHGVCCWRGLFAGPRPEKPTGHREGSHKAHILMAAACVPRVQHSEPTVALILCSGPSVWCPKSSTSHLALKS